jgi:hypothetical protein
MTSLTHADGVINLGTKEIVGRALSKSSDAQLAIAVLNSLLNVKKTEHKPIIIPLISNLHNTQLTCLLCMKI